MQNKLIWSPNAEYDFVNIVEYLVLEWTEFIALEFIDNIDSDIILIYENPKLFPFVNIAKKVRKCVNSKHNTIFYREHNSSIEILRIFDTRQNPQNLIF